MNVTIKARGWRNGLAYDIDQLVDLNRISAADHAAAVYALETLRKLIEDAWREVGYSDGESSGDANWTMALSDVLPDRGPEWEWTPQAVAGFIKAEMERNQ